MKQHVKPWRWLVGYVLYYNILLIKVLSLNLDFSSTSVY